jgi:Uma2 family endonuclease
MTTIVKQKMTYADFLQFDNGMDYLYELEDGELIQVPSESDINQLIAIFLLVYLSQHGIPFSYLRTKAEIAVIGKQVNVRVPDLVVFSPDLAEKMKGKQRSLITLDMPAPSLVVEVVSPNQSKRDYEDKRQEYGARGIPEYWIVDPLLNKVTVLQLKDGVYQDQVYTADQPIVSLLLGKTTLTAQAILTGGEA